MTRAEPRGIVLSSRFKKDLKKLTPEHHTALLAVVDYLRFDRPLPSRYRSHLLVGAWVGYYECHVKPDLLLIWKVDGDELRLARIGSHTKLFNR
jgi:mRNA interferase YafQ